MLKPLFLHFGIILIIKAFCNQKVSIVLKSSSVIFSYCSLKVVVLALQFRIKNLEALAEIACFCAVTRSMSRWSIKSFKQTARFTITYVALIQSSLVYCTYLTNDTVANLCFWDSLVRVNKNCFAWNRSVFENLSTFENLCYCYIFEVYSTHRYTRRSLIARVIR